MNWENFQVWPIRKQRQFERQYQHLEGRDKIIASPCLWPPLFFVISLLLQSLNGEKEEARAGLTSGERLSGPNTGPGVPDPSEGMC